MTTVRYHSWYLLNWRTHLHLSSASRCLRIPPQIFHSLRQVHQTVTANDATIFQSITDVGSKPTDTRTLTNSVVLYCSDFNGYQEGSRARNGSPNDRFNEDYCNREESVRFPHTWQHPWVILTNLSSIRIGSCGLVDVLTFDTRQDVAALQLEDLTHFGRLIFALCCNNVSAAVGPNFQKSLDHIHRTYGTEIKTLALFLISKPTPHKVYLYAMMSLNTVWWPF